MSAAVREVRDPAELAAIDRLYRRVFGVPDDHNGMNLRLLVGIGANSGHVLGAFDADGLVGFGLSFLARDAGTGRLYQYSQTVAVAPEAQSRRIGRRLKAAQRAAALADGVDLMRWAYDPMQARNAHFNLDVLGGRVRRLHRDFYGTVELARDAGEPTDRFVVDWELAAEPRPQCGGNGMSVAIPADWAAYRAAHGRAAAERTRREAVDRLGAALASGLVAVSCRRTGADTAAYVLVPEQDR